VLIIRYIRVVVQAKGYDAPARHAKAWWAFLWIPMTCIVGLVNDGKVYIGGDSAAVSGDSLTVRSDEKVFANGRFLFGFTSSFRMGQVLRYGFRPPAYYPDNDVMAYMVTDFIDAVRAALKEAGFARKDDEAESGGTFLVGFKGRLFKVCDDYQVGEATGYDACGCGQDIAFGALFASPAIEPQARVIQALRAAEAHCSGVRGPYQVLCI
jgi:hypothetical protein